MHIIIDATTTQDQLAYAGIGQYTKNITLSLLKLYPDVKFSILLFSDRESTLGDEAYKHKNANIVNIGKYRVSDYQNDIWYFLNFLPKIKKIRQKDSIYFCPYFWRNYPAYSIPTVLFVHDMNLAMFNMYSQVSPIHNLIRGIQYWIAMYKSLKCKYIICNSETTKRDYLKYFPRYSEEKITVSYLGVTLDEKGSSLKNILPSDYEERGYLIHLGGGINKTKNTEGVIGGYISFLKLLGKKREDSPYLVIAGKAFKEIDRKEVKKLLKIIEENKVQDNVIFTGLYTEETKYSLLNNSFAFIHLSLYEGFGLSAIEALKAKVPVILNINPVYNELFKEVGVMVDGNNYEEVGKKIYDIYTNSEKYESRVGEGYELSKRYTWENTARITYDTFKKVLK